MERNESIIEGKISEWRDIYISSGHISDVDLDELEDHLREEIQELSSKGLSEEEAFFVAVRRIGNSSSLSKEFRKINIHDIWKSLFREPADIEERRNQTKGLILVIVLALSAGLLTELTRLFGFGFEEDVVFYVKNASFFVLPFATIFLMKTRQLSFPASVTIFIAFFLSLLLINLYPFSE